ncbi:unnamed protein product, partial [Brachionus calyciflorus]
IRIRKILDNWVRFQSSWIYMEPIFGHEDICQQIPHEGEMFRQVDKLWKNLMFKSAQNPKALSVLNQDKILENLEYAVSKLENINKGLNYYLEEKRLYFPRFFFLSNDELLEILSETKDPLRVQPHLKKCFEGIRLLKFEGDLIEGMLSDENEYVQFKNKLKPNDARGLVEIWLLQVEKEMQLSLHLETKNAIKKIYEMNRFDWISSFAGQIVQAVNFIKWTSDVTNSILNQNGLENFLLESNKRLEELVIMVRGELSSMTRITIEALIVLDVHARDVVEILNTKKVTNIDDFDWISQMRYYWKDEKIEVRIITTLIEYAYEYLGNTSRLVITPLTDRCFRTLMSAIQLNLGGAPEGPAGTGKTETCKDLAKAVAKQCVVFNCSDGLDYKAMGKFFKGLSQSGAWACFDEFNRIELEVLSVVAQQIQTIQKAIAENKIKFMFEDVELILDPTCSIFITMNPGYAGRSELPDNLKILFRPVAMMVPDYQLIAQISLYSMGFVEARILAGKIVSTYKLCSEQLSSQHHYDYGMRAVKTVLNAAGKLKLKFLTEKEEILILKSIKDVNLPKFLPDDVNLFNGIISDLFPGINIKKNDTNHLEKCLIDSLKLMNMEYNDWFMERILQIYDMLNVRHGLMIIGDTMSGKTTSYKSLALALSDLYKDDLAVDFEIINPKSINIGNLFGRFDPISHEWYDGIVAKIFREHSLSDSKRKWIVFDGPVDALWIENMNTVLDDNKKLCLMSGEIIKMSSKQNMIFEARDLEQASPATVSRCGMIYLDSMSLGYKILIKSWFKNKFPKHLNKIHAKMLELLFDWLLQPCLIFSSNSKLFLNQSQIMLTNSFLNILTCLLDDIKTYFDEEEEEEEKKSEDVNDDYMDVFKKELNSHEKRIEEDRKDMLVAYFIWSLVWSIGNILRQESREKFSYYFLNLIHGNNKDYPRPRDLQFGKSALIPKENNTIYDYAYVHRNLGIWVKWSSLIDEFIIPKNVKPIDVFVTTIETYRQTFFLQKLLVKNYPVIFVGNTGTGKTSIMTNYLGQLSCDNYVVNNINFSARTSCNQVQETIMSKMKKLKKGLYAAENNKMSVFFIDDLNMPSLDKHGSQPSIELLRNIIDHKFIYELKANNLISIKNCLIVGAFVPPGSGRNDVTSRFLRHFNVLGIESFNDDLFRTIFCPIMEWHYDSYDRDNDFHKFSPMMMIDATLNIYNKVVDIFLPTPSKSHYLFNSRDFSRVINGLLLFKMSNLIQNDVKSDEIMHENSMTLIRLWVHEVYRVFCDRLVDTKDRDQFYLIVKKISICHFNSLKLL